MKFNSIKTKLTITVSITTIIILASIVSYTVISTKKLAVQSAEREMILLAEEYALKIKGKIEIGKKISNNLAGTLSTLHQDKNSKIDRAGMNKILLNKLKDNPSIFGICTLWEPNAFDNKDSEFKNTKNHDSTGRFIPYWTRHKNKFVLEPLVEYTIEGKGDWYLLPKRTKNEVFLGPYNYKVLGKDVFMISLVTPILHNNKFKAIVAVDISIDFLQKYAEKAKDKIFNGKGNISIIANNGIYAANTLNPEQNGKNIAEYFKDVKKQLKSIEVGEIQKYYNNNKLEIRVPFAVEKTITPWQVRISIDKNIIFADAQKQMWILIILGSILIFLTLTIINIQIGVIIKPLKELVKSVNKIAKGNFKQTIEIKSDDEIGLLSKSFNKMSKNVLQLTDDLEGKIVLLNEKNSEYEAVNEELSATTDELKKSNSELKFALKKAEKNIKLEKALENLIKNDKKQKKLNEELQASEEELRQINEELKASNENVEKQFSEIQTHKNRLRAILDNSNAVIYVKDINGRYLIVNKLFEKLFKITEKEIIGKTDYDIFPKEIADKLAKNDKNIIKEKAPLKFEEVVLHEDGLHTYVSMKFLIYNDKNKVYAVGGISTDITDRIKAENEIKKKSKELKKLNKELISLNKDYEKQNKELIITKELAEIANEAKSRFLANMSHEIRTPMNAILGFSEILHKKITNPEFEQYLTAISSSGKSLNVLINDILDLSKIEASKIKISYSTVDFYKFIDGIVLMFDNQIEKKGLDFIREIDSNLPEYIIIDEIRVKQIISNLMSNAIKFTSSGYIKLSIQIIKKTKSLCTLKFLIADSGIGIPKNQQKVIFKAFRQQKDQAFDNYRGTGLGLSICKGLADRMGSEIKLKSEKNKGSEFSFILKNIKITNASNLKTEANYLDEKTIVFEKATILIAEDIKLNRDLLISFISDFNFDIIQAVNGKQAVELATKHLPQLILMDIRMPILNGLEATKQLKANDKTKHIPIIAVTASTTGTDKASVIEACDDYLFKPVSFNKLIQTISKYLKHTIKNDLPKEEKNIKTIKNTSKILNNPVKLYNLLKNNIEPKWKVLKNTMIINEVIDFADDLEKNYKLYNYKKLTEWANNLKTKAQIFDLDALEKSINLFPDLLKELLKILKDERL